MVIKKLAVMSLSALLLVMLNGCAALNTSISKRNLVVETKMSDSLFLDPAGKKSRSVYLEIRNSTGKQKLDLYNPIKVALLEKGFRVIDDPEAAHYWLRANVLSIGKSDPRKARSILGAGYGGPFTGLLLGSSVVGLATRSWFGAGAGGLGGGVAEVVSEAFVKDVMFMVVTDVEVSAKVGRGVLIRQNNLQNARQGQGGYRTQTSTETSNRQKYRTRIVSTANQVNLKYEEAIPEISQGLAHSLSGIF
jgi:hypothetical protein